MFEGIAEGLNLILRWNYLFFVLVGVTLGNAVGVLPGLTATMGVALLIPLTFGLDAASAFGLLMGIYVGAFYGGGITACLLHTPGTPAAAATVLDGYPMVQKGEGEKALGIVALASLVGGILSTIVLLIVAPPLARFAMKFGPAELFLIIIFGLIPIASIGSESLTKGLIAGVIGMLVGTIGIDPISGAMRFTADYPMLYEGISVIVALIGLYSVSQVRFLAEEEGHKTIGAIDKRIKRVKIPWRDLKTYWATYLRSTIIGVFIGAIPGEGASIACFVSYNESKRWSKHPGKFGTGHPEGLAAAESSDNAVAGGSFIPTLSLGIPGNAVTAVFLGALMLHGLAPGPRLFAESPGLVYSLILGRFVANMLMLLVFLATAKHIANIIRIPNSLLIPIIMVLSVVGAFGIRNSLFDVFLIFPFGIIGYFMRKYKYPLAATVLGVILGPMAEAEIRRALIISGGDYSMFFTRPICVVLIVLIVLMLIVPYFTKRKKQNRISS